jgi:hypothetical protein
MLTMNNLFPSPIEYLSFPDSNMGKRWEKFKNDSNKELEFYLIGERHNGTNKTIETLKKVGLKQRTDFGFKHWLKPGDIGHIPNTTTDTGVLKRIEDDPDVIIIFNVRDPLSWGRSFWNPAHHVDMTNINEKNKYNVKIRSRELKHRNNWKKNRIGEEYFIEEDDNLSELRKRKLNAWLSYKDKLPNEFHIVHTETLKYDIIKILNKHNINTNSVKIENKPFKANNITYEEQQYLKRLDPLLESKIGYDILRFI